jgi:mannose-1-phosphate guanylyltransferase
MKAMILAAGLGTRLRPFSLLRPKPLFPVLDKPLILHTIRQLHEYGITEIAVNCHHLKQQVFSLLRELPGIYLQQEEKILGTGGGLRKARDFFGSDPVLIINGDIFHTINIASVITSHLESGAAATLVLHDLPRFNSVTVGKDDNILGFGKGQHTGKLLAFTGIHVLDPALLAVIPEDTFANIIDCYRYWIDKGTRIAGLEMKNHYWTDMGTPQDYLGLHAYLLSKENSGTANNFYLGKDVSIADDVILDDWVSIGSRCSIGRGVSLKRVVVWDGVRVKDGARFSDAIVV